MNELKIIHDFPDDVKELLAGLVAALGKCEAPAALKADEVVSENSQETKPEAAKAEPVKKTRKPRAKKTEPAVEEAKPDNVTEFPVVTMTAEDEPEPAEDEEFEYTPDLIRTAAYETFKMLAELNDPAKKPELLTDKMRELGAESLDDLDAAKYNEFADFIKSLGGADFLKAVPRDER